MQAARLRAPSPSTSAKEGEPAAASLEPAGGGAYVLGTGAGARDRLQVSEEAYGWAMTALVDRLRNQRPKAWPQAPMRMAIAACGTGSQLENLAKLAGQGSSLWCSDVSQAQLDVAQEAAAKLGASDVHFDCVDLERAPQAGLFDVVHARFVLVHLQKPSDALRHMWQMVRPGGMLVSEEHAVDGIDAAPPLETIGRAKGWLRALGAARGVNFDLGLELPSLFAAAEVPLTDVEVRHVGFTEGAGKRLLEMSLREGATSYVEAGIASASELDEACDVLAEYARRRDTKLFVGHLAQAWAARPPA